MLTQNIRQMIQNACAHTGADTALEQHLEQVLSPRLRNLDRHSAKEAANLVLGYIEQVPTILDHAISHASSYGELDTISPLLNQAAQYFFEPEDYIPDRIGIYGLLDDAYLCLRMLEMINQVYLREYGAYLLPMDLAPMNQIIRPFLGDGLAAQLDHAINTAIEQRAYQVASLQQLGQRGYNSKQNLVSKDWGNFEQNAEQFLFDNGMVMEHTFE